MKRRQLIVAAALVTTCILFARPARATSILINGDFETGDFTGWTPLTQCGIPPPTMNCFGTSFGVVRGIPHSGMYDAAFSGSGDFGRDRITQTVETTPGQAYALSFWMAVLPNTGCTDPPALCLTNVIEVLWEGRTIFSANGLVPSDYVLRTVSVAATGTTASLSFGLSNLRGVSLIDDITLAAVPEPASIGLLALGLLILAARRLLNAHAPSPTLPPSSPFGPSPA